MARLVRNTKMWLAEDLLCLAEGRCTRRGYWLVLVRVKPGGAICNTQISVLPPLSSVFEPCSGMDKTRKQRCRSTVHLAFALPAQIRR